MRQIGTFAGAALLGLAGYAQAQVPTPEPRLTMDSGFYLGAGGGRARVTGDCGPVCDQRDTTWGAYAGYQFNRYFAIEGGYSDFGTMTSSGTVIGGTAVATIDTTAWEFAALAMAPFTDRFSAFLKIGVFRYESDATTSGVVVPATSNAKGTEYTVGVGLQYMYTDHIGARLEWQRYNDVGTGVAGLGKDSLNVWRLSGRFKF